MKVSTVPMENSTLRYSSYLNIASEQCLITVTVLTPDYHLYNLTIACTLQFLTRSLTECPNSQVFNCTTPVHALHSMMAWT